MGPLDAFRAMYRRVHQEQPLDPADLHAPRSNVLVFYGMGGIGKTRLLQRCEWLARTENLVVGGRPATFRIDLRDQSFLDPEAVVMALRAAAGVSSGVRLPAFDLAFSVYWATKHPGVELRSFLNRSGWLARVTRNPGLHDQIVETVEGLIGTGGLAATGMRIGRALVTHLRSSARTRSLLEKCPRLSDMLATPDPDALRAYLPYLLAWDLAQLPPRDRIELTVFVDTFEEAQTRSRDLGDIEDTLARAVYLMPNVLFVLGGRNRVRWADTTMPAQVLFHGPDRWTGLAEGATNSDQYVLGSLSADDAWAYLSARLPDPDAVTVEAMRRVVAAAAGWPLYLDLQATRLERRLARGLPVHPDEYGGGLVEAVVRVMRDLDQWERDLLRAVSLPSTVDRQVLRAALPEARESAVDNFLQLSLLATAPDRRGLNGALRESLRQADAQLEDRWSEEQWRVVASRIVDYLGAASPADPAVMTAYLLDGFELSSRYQLKPGWLAIGADRVFSRGSWEVLRAIAGSPAVQASPLRPLGRAVEAAARRSSGDTRGAAALAFEAAAALDEFAAELRDYIAWQAASSLERSGDRAAAAAYCRQIQTPTFRPRSIVRLGRLAWIDDDLVRAQQYAAEARSAAEAAAAERPAAGDAAELYPSGEPVVITSRSLTAWVLLTQGRFAEAEVVVEEALDAARSRDDGFFIASEWAHLAFLRAIASPATAAPTVAQALAEAERIGSTRQQIQAQTAQALLAGAAGNVADALQTLGGLADTLARAGDQLDLRIPWLAAVIVLARAGERAEAGVWADRLRDVAERHRAHRCSAVIAGWLCGTGGGAPSDDLHWGEDVALVRQRWEMVVR